MIAPHREGFPIPIRELDIPPSRLDLENEYSFNNHHRLWTARRYGRLLIYQTLRNLNSFQDITAKDVHERYHQRYQPPPLPTLGLAMDRLQQAYVTGEPLKLGPIRQPIFKGISPELWQSLKEEYEREAA